MVEVDKKLKEKEIKNFKSKKKVVLNSYLKDVETLGNERTAKKHETLNTIISEAERKIIKQVLFENKLISEEDFYKRTVEEVKIIMDMLMNPSKYLGNEFMKTLEDLLDKEKKMTYIG